MKQSIAIFIALFFMSNLTIAQSNRSDYFNSDASQESESEANSSTDALSLDRIKFNVNLGSSFSTYNSGNTFSNYISPSFSYLVSSKLRINGGFWYENLNLTNTPVWGMSGLETVSGNYNRNAFWLSGEYQINSQLTVYGTVMVGATPNCIQMMNPNAMNNITYSIGAQYKVTDNLEIGVEIQHTTQSPFSNGGNENLPKNPYDKD